MSKLIRLFPNSRSLFLPSPQEVWGLSGGPENFEQLFIYIKLLQQGEEGIKTDTNEMYLGPGIKRRTLNNASRGGVSEKSAQKILKAMHGPGAPDLSLLIPQRVQSLVDKYPGVWAFWQGFFLGRFFDNIDYPHVKRFLAKRFLSARQLCIIGKNRLPLKRKLEIAMCIYERGTKISPKILHECFQFMEKYHDHRCLNMEMVSQDERLALAEMKLDFYLHLFACIEYDITTLLFSHDRGSERHDQEIGILERLMPQESNKGVRLPLDLFLNHLRIRIAERIKKRKKPLTWLELAQYLPDPKLSNRVHAPTDQEEKEIVDGSKLREIYYWRSGKRNPSDEKWRSFIANILYEAGGFLQNSFIDQQFAFLVLRCSIAISGLYTYIRSTYKVEESEAIALFSNYGKYRDAVSQRAALRPPAST